MKDITSDYLMQLLVSESADLDDPMGVATLTVERSTGFNGEVVVYWEVEDDGIDDLEPASGNLTFADVSSCNNIPMLIPSIKSWEWNMGMGTRLHNTMHDH